MSPLEEEKYMTAGRILSRVLSFAGDTVDDGMKILDLCETIEEKIKDLGGLPAFPCNISQGRLAAHYTPSPNDNGFIDGRSIVKIDVGVHTDGYIADAAISITWNQALESLVEAAQEVLMLGISVIKHGLRVSEFGYVVEGYAKAHGFKPVGNLAGHQLGKYVLHSGLSVPNVATASPGTFKAGGVYALEPFLVPGHAAGRVVDGPPSNIFRLRSRRFLKDPASRKVSEWIWDNFRSLPFASRWVYKEFGDGGMETLRALKSRGVVSEYPMLLEVSGAQVAQFEHTVLVDKDKVLVTTMS